MTRSTSDRPGEFELIAKLFAPLSHSMTGAYGLIDDVAVLSPSAGCEVVLKTDTIVESVHFRRQDSARTIAKKVLRMNLSDFAAKGAEPSAYLVSLSLPDWTDNAWLEEFAVGLAEDQSEYGVTLVGGDTTRTPGVMTISVMLTGFVPNGALIRRRGAKPGDAVFVTGTIGDAGAGLELLRKPGAAVSQSELVSRYLVPRPRLAFGRSLRGIANAALDVSDGLVADLGHIAAASDVRIEVQAELIPLSSELISLCGREMPALVAAGTSGDDYEIAFTAPPERREVIRERARGSGTAVTEIGRVVSGRGIALLDAQGQEVPLERQGYTHF